jgi:hypothetical protein
MEEYEKAETEIQLFSNDFGADGPVLRYKVRLLLARAEYSKGLMDEDRHAILTKACNQSRALVKRFDANRDMLKLYCDVGVACIRRNGDFSCYDDAMACLKRAEELTGDPDLSKLIVTYDQQRVLAMRSQTSEEQQQEI